MPAVTGASRYAGIYLAVVWKRISSAMTRATTGSQAPGHFRRKSRIVGYQGLSARSSIQRQSAAASSNVHTGTPSAPARWATIVSTEITRSSARMRRAASTTASALDRIPTPC